MSRRRPKRQSHFYLLALTLRLGAAGMGGVLAINVVYMAEIAPSAVRGRMIQTTQAFAPFLLTCWVTCYGPLGFLSLYLVRVGFDARAIFTAGLVAAVFGSPAIPLALQYVHVHSGRLSHPDPCRRHGLD